MIRSRLGAVVVLVVAGCASEGHGTAVRTEATPDGWMRDELPGRSGADNERGVAVDGNTIVVAVVTEEGELRSYRSDGGEAFTAGPSHSAGFGIPGIGALVRFDGRWIALGGSLRSGDEDHGFDVKVVSSEDGLRWEPITPRGFDVPADVADALVDGDHIFAVGTLRTAEDPSRGGFVPVVWRSGDAVSWTATPLSTRGDGEGSVRRIAAVGDRLLALGHADGRGALWESTDGGGSWTATQLDGIAAPGQVGGLVTDGDTAVLSASRSTSGTDGVLFLRSGDAGQTWSEASAPPPVDSTEGFPSPVFRAGGRFLSLVYGYLEPWSAPEVCYADIDQCRQGIDVQLYVSDDGDTWARVDTSALGEDGDLDDLVGTDDGRIVGLRSGREGTEVWTWPASRDLPTVAPVEVAIAEIDLLEEGEEPVVGRRYAAPLYVHCGMDWMYLADVPWQRSDQGAEVETGASEPVPEHWPVAAQTVFGFATLVDERTVEYSIGDGEVIATYEPARSQPPGCE